MSNPFLTQSLNNQNINVTSSSSLSIKMEQIKDVSVPNSQAGQVLIYSGSIWQHIIPQSVVNYTIGALLDVNVTSLQNAQYLSYSSTLAADNDCSISSPATNQALIYNSSSKWSNTNLTHNLLTDTSIISINNGDILRWNGAQFVNSSTLTNDERH